MQEQEHPLPPAALEEAVPDHPGPPSPAAASSAPSSSVPLRTPAAREYLEALLIAIIFATFVRTYAFQAFKIPSGSMEPNLLIGDHLLVNKFIYGPASGPLERLLLPQREVSRGDVVVFRFPREPWRDFIKRAVGLPGDSVRLIDKRLYINGRRVEDEGYVAHRDPVIYPRGAFLDISLRPDNFGPYTVPAGAYFCLGDNRDFSQDSRFWGVVDRKYLKGRAFMVYWSFGSDAPETIEGTGLRGKIAQLGHVAWHFFDETRWRRTFRLVR